MSGSIYATGKAGDYAYLSGTANNTTFVGTSTYSYVTGTGFMDQVAGFGVINAYGGAGGTGNNAYLGRGQWQQHLWRYTHV